MSSPSSPSRPAPPSAALLALALVALGGCAYDGAGGRSPSNAPADDPVPETAPPATVPAVAQEGVDAELPPAAALLEIAADLAVPMAALLEPRTRVVQIGRDESDPLALAYLGELIDRGVAVQYTGSDQGAWRLAHAISAPDADARRYLLSAGPLSVERAYRVDGDRPVAISPLSVTGSRAAVPPGAGRVEAAAFMDRVTYADPPDVEAPAPLISLLGTDLGAGAAGGGRGGTGDVDGVPSATGITPDRVEVANLFLSADRFASIETTHRRVDRHVVVFANDSLSLGADNRALLYRFVDESVEPADELLLVGCSNGPTRHEGGNEGLALGRASRVVDALVALGIGRRRVREEGCWAGTADPEGLPGRGVVVDVWRPLGAGAEASR